MLSDIRPAQMKLSYEPTPIAPMSCPTLAKPPVGRSYATFELNVFID